MPIPELMLGGLYGLVDMGSNGIRFSITELLPSTARSLPVVFQERLGVSLYDAQHSTGVRGPIPQNIIDDVLTGLKRFKAICVDFGVLDENVRVLATEATRTAENSQDYRQQIKDATGWDVNMLTKEDEGRIGAMGIASSFETVDGLVMDLGGGSTQFSWLIHEHGDVAMPEQGSVSFPYGAAAMTKLLADIDASKDPQQGRADLKAKIKKEYTDALESLELPDTLTERIKSHGLTMYLSGGGFRGWGYILMSKAKKGPYPIPIINGYHLLVKEFADVDMVKDAAENADGIFRVSKRRASQVPAVSFLVDTICEAFPFIKDVRFSQGGVREGYLFSNLTPQTKALSPLSSATARYAKDANSASYIATLLSLALPANGTTVDRWYPSSLTPALLRAVADTMYVQLHAPKESASLSALCLPVTGVLAAAHGIAHGDRALLALTLCQRWGGDLPPPYDDMMYRLSALLTDQEVWWAKYLGTVAALVGDMYPSGKVRHNDDDEKSKRTRISSEWAYGLGKKANQQGIKLKLTLMKHGITAKDVVKERVENIEDMGKKKNRAGGKEYGFGLPVEVEIEWT